MNIIKNELYDFELSLLKKLAEILLIEDYKKFTGIELANEIFEILTKEDNSDSLYNNIRLKLKNIILTYGKQLKENEKMFETELRKIKNRFKEKEEKLLMDYKKEIKNFLTSPLTHINFKI